MRSRRTDLLSFRINPQHNFRHWVIHHLIAHNAPPHPSGAREYSELLTGLLFEALRRKGYFQDSDIQDSLPHHPLVYIERPSNTDPLQPEETRPRVKLPEKPLTRSAYAQSQESVSPKKIRLSLNASYYPHHQLLQYIADYAPSDANTTYYGHLLVELLFQHLVWLGYAEEEGTDENDEATHPAGVSSSPSWVSCSVNGDLMHPDLHRVLRKRLANPPEEQGGMIEKGNFSAYVGTKTVELIHTIRTGNEASL